MRVFQFYLILVFVFIFSIGKAQKSGTAVNPTPAITKEIKAKGILNNKTGLDACGWVIKLNTNDANDHEFLEPLNLNKFKIKLVEGKKVEFIYTEQKANSACMIGTIVMLKSIKSIK